MSYYLGKLAFLICLLLAACAGIEPAKVATDGPGLVATASPQPVSTQPTPTPTPGPEVSPTVRKMRKSTSGTSETQAVETATATPSPENTSQVVEPSPSLTPTMQPAGSQDAIQIFTPGEGFRVTSPLTVAANLKGLVQGAYRVELFGRDGRLLYRQVWGRPEQAIQGLPLDLQILFQIPAEEEEGRLVITRLDAANRLQTVESSDLKLLSSGTDSGREGQVIQDSILIQAPLESEQASGGMVRVAGRTRAPVGEVLRIQLVNEEGKVVGQRVTSVEAGPEDQGIFSSEVPYKVEVTTPTRLVVFALGDPVSPIRYLASRDVVLIP